MDNVEKIEDFFSKMKGLLDNAKKQGHIIVRVEDLENIFPELKESEDEKIRKKLIEVVKGDMVIGGAKDKQRAIAWLEKQSKKDKLIHELGEYKVKYIQETLGKALTMNNKDDERIRKTIIAFLKDFADKGYENAVECIDWLEKQGEKPQGKSALEAINEEKIDNKNCMKSTNKVKSNFNAGDWITNGEYTWKVISVDYLDYTLKNNENKYVEDSIDYVDKVFHLWTIQDAKDCDVLHSPSHHLTWIYKDNEHYYVCINMNYVIENVCIDGLISIPNDACPATKDEQTILFARIEKSGYEWVADKKELQKEEVK